ncbi:hypothetical protein B7494_g8067 [Chlorociboria aeruginascens]|nr:hypothetical protein B7494_g8067 [Chlorociboria aeruginascens]
MSSSEASTSQTPGAPSDKKKLRPTNEYFLSTNMVEIYVGEERKLWVLHEDLLCDRIDFFASAFKSGFKEGREKKMDLEEEDPEAFGLLVDWIYGRLECTESHQDPLREGHVMRWAKLWILADKWRIKELTCDALECCNECVYLARWCPDAEDVEFVFGNGPESSPLRDWMLTEVAMVAFNPHVEIDKFTELKHRAMLPQALYPTPTMLLMVILEET